MMSDYTSGMHLFTKQKKILSNRKLKPLDGFFKGIKIWEHFEPTCKKKATFGCDFQKECYIARGNNFLKICIGKKTYNYICQITETILFLVSGSKSVKTKKDLIKINMIFLKYIRTILYLYKNLLRRVILVFLKI